MTAIFKREFKSFFITPIGYVFLILFSLFSSFVINLIIIYKSTGTAEIDVFFANLPFPLMIFIPILTMRIFSEEKKNKTEQLLLCAPVSVTAIVMGKFLAALSIFGLALGTTLIYPVIYEIYGTPQYGNLITQYIGYILYGAAFITIGIYISSKTENQIISVLSSFVIMFAINSIDMLIPLTSNPVITKILEFFSGSRRFEDFYRSLLNPASMVYFLAMAGLFIFLTIRNIERRRHI